MDIRYPMPPELFNSMLCYFNFLEMEGLQFMAIFSYIRSKNPNVDFTNLRFAEEVKATTPETNFSYVFDDASSEIYDDMQ